MKEHIDLGLSENTFRQNHFGPGMGVTQAAGFKYIHGYGHSLKYRYWFEIEIAICLPLPNIHVTGCVQHSSSTV